MHPSTHVGGVRDLHGLERTGATVKDAHGLVIRSGDDNRGLLSRENYSVDFEVVALEFADGVAARHIPVENCFIATA